jgi:osmotically-inducible protein OsmY
MHPASTSLRPTSTVLSISLLSLALGLSGCWMDRTSYPDTSDQTKIRADEIHADTARRTATVDADLARREQAYDYRVTQSKERAVRDRGEIALAHDRKVEPLQADEVAAKGVSTREQTRLDAELAAKLTVVDGTEAAKVRADESSAKAAVVATETAAIAKLTAEREELDTKARDQRAAADGREAKELADIQAEREETIRTARADRLAIEDDAAKRLTGMAKDSKQRMTALSASEATTLEQDRSIDQAVRASLDREREHNAQVAFRTQSGVVTLTGTIADEATRAETVGRISKLSGVNSVNDQLTLR